MKRKHLASIMIILAMFVLAQWVSAYQTEGEERMETEGKAKKVVIDGVDTYRVIEPMVEGVRIILAHQGEKYSPAYIQGISGIAFQIAGICVCAPTCGPAMGPEDVIKLLGYNYEHIPLSGEGIVPEKEVPNLVDRVKDEIRAGRPVLVWHAFTNAEWDVVYGFDEEKKQFLGRGSYAGNDKEYASADETRTAKCGDICDPLGAIVIGEKTGEYDARKAELAALRWAVDHAHSKRGEDQLDGDKWVFLEGLMAYDRWISDFRNPEKKRESGDSYCYGIFKSTHRAASDFLTEIAPNYPEAAEHLKKAGEHFKTEADMLDSGTDLLWWNAPQGPDAERNAKAVELLSKARESYAGGMQEIEKALMVIDSKGYGFRYDPMKLIESDDTLQGAKVRVLVLNQPRDGDRELIQAEIDRMIAEQNEDGSFGKEEDETSGKICDLLELGYPADKTEMQMAADALVCLVQEKKTLSRVLDEGEELPMGITDARALCLIGKTDLPGLHATIRWYADHVDDWINRGCPWGQSMIMAMLGAGREVEDVEAGLTQALTWVADSINGAGCLSYFDPWSFVKLAGTVDHPLTRRILEKQLPLILATQNPDGGWAMPEWWATEQGSFNAFRALNRHGLLDELQKRPPLPVGWKVERSIPAPEGDLWGLAWDGEKWWTCNGETNTAVAVSPENGKVIKQVKLPEGNGRGFGWWNGAIALNQGCPWEKDPKRLVRVDPDTGEILQEFPLDFLNHVGGVTHMDGKAWVVDSFYGWLMSLDADGKTVRDHVSLAGPLPVAITPDGDSLWHDDLWVPFFIKSGLEHDGQFIDCIEKPFKEPFARKPYGGVVRGMGHDGKNLWVLDNKNKRICMVKRPLVAAEREGVEGVKELENLDFVPRATSHMGVLEGCLKYLGIDASPGWLYGSTGHAFIMNIGDDLCPSGPHCWNWSTVNRLGKNIGYEAKNIYTNANKEDLSQKQEQAWDFVRKSIDNGFPCYGWHYEFVVINGYDDNGYLLSGPMDDAPGDWRKFGIDAVGFMDIWSIRPGQKADDITTIKDALCFAVSFIEESADSPDAGLSGYGNWIKGLESGKCSADGGAYHAAIWAECRRFALEFLEEANQRAGKKYESLFQPAIEQYKLVSDNLNEVEKLFPYKSATEDEWKRNMEDEKRRQEAVEHLKAAKSAEAAGLESLARIVEAMQTYEQIVIPNVDH